MGYTSYREYKNKICIKLIEKKRRRTATHHGSAIFVEALCVNKGYLNIQVRVGFLSPLLSPPAQL
jgi:hypothetical protein